MPRCSDHLPSLLAWCPRGWRGKKDIEFWRPSQNGEQLEREGLHRSASVFTKDAHDGRTDGQSSEVMTVRRVHTKSVRKVIDFQNQWECLCCTACGWATISLSGCSVCISVCSLCAQLYVLVVVSFRAYVPSVRPCSSGTEPNGLEWRAPKVECLRWHHLQSERHPYCCLACPAHRVRGYHTGRPSTSTRRWKNDSGRRVVGEGVASLWHLPSRRRRTRSRWHHALAAKPIRKRGKTKDTMSFIRVKAADGQLGNKKKTSSNCRRCDDSDDNWTVCATHRRFERTALFDSIPLGSIFSSEPNLSTFIKTKRRAKTKVYDDANIVLKTERRNSVRETRQKRTRQQQATTGMIRDEVNWLGRADCQNPIRARRYRIRSKYLLSNKKIKKKKE